ncbi:hypothetical protein [Saccharothrix sp. HUAS TT1]|uniref:hypothetical protein n=1 Tax=unclassified Saccharothrix TaxID=2593673 RepID=UPI00345BFCD6
MSPVTITRQTYRAALQAAVDARGADFTYQSPDGTCLYVHHDEELGTTTPGCLHGFALAVLGYELDSTHEYTPIRTLLSVLGVRGDDVLREAAQESQRAQDRGESWGRALEVFDQYAEC